MPRLRFTIAGLLGVVAFAAVGFAALRSGSDLWASTIFTLTAATLATAVLLSIHRQGRARAFWIGVALFGWLHLVGCQLPEIRGRLLTSELIDVLAQQIPNDLIDGSKPANEWISVDRVDMNRDGDADKIVYAFGPGSAFTANALGPPMGFYRIGEDLATLGVGLIGGLVSLRLRGSSKDRLMSLILDKNGA